MRGPLYLAWRYLVHHRVKTLILISSISLILALPPGLEVLIESGARSLTERAESTPLIVGARGSALELVLNSLYFESEAPVAMEYREVERVEESGLARAVPLHVRFRARNRPVVGTSLDYFELRGLRVESGRGLTLLGECIVGARAARELDLAPGDFLVTSTENVFDLAGVYPLRLHVVGVLGATGTADDGAVFVDLKTAWIIEGLGHGHQDLATPEAQRAVLSREGGRITANASVVEFNEITAANIDSFHFHGDLSDHPVTSLIALPHDDKSRVLLMGRYESKEERVQAVRPLRVIEELLATVVKVQGYAAAAIGVVGLATLATSALVFLLSLRLRRREIETLVKIGGARTPVAIVLASEIVAVLAIALLAAAVLTGLASRFGPMALRALIL